MNKANGTVIIVGGSLTGLAAAIALAQTGAKVSVLEQTLAPDRGGTGLGVDRALLAALVGSDPRSDTEQSHLPVIVTTRETSTWQAIRSWLQMLAARTAGLEVLEGVRVTAVSQDSFSATAFTETGSHTADAIIGADGYRSVVRRYVDPAHQHARYGGFLIWRGLVPESLLSPRTWGSRILGGRLPVPETARLICYHVPGADGSVRIGTRQFTFAWYDAARDAWLRSRGDLDGEEVLRSVEGRSIDDPMREGLRAAAERAWSGAALEVVRTAIDAGFLFGTPLTEYLPRRLATGRIAIIGDAAHVASPMVGHGLALGWMDAHALAAAIVHAGSVDTEALSAYERARLAPSRAHVAESMSATRAMLSDVIGQKS
jgi:2-polyprenyl-6-methoxyphenol hydroxylase-like FAD-dependent oxidoreductase